LFELDQSQFDVSMIFMKDPGQFKEAKE